MHRRLLLTALASGMLLVYGIVLPQLLIGHATAHDLGWDLVRGGRIDYYNGIRSSLGYAHFITLAAMEWEDISGIEIRPTNDLAEAEVALFTMCLRRDPYLMAKTTSNGVTKFNTCLMEHKGGKLGPLSYLPATTPSRKIRTFYHEFGHMLRLDHPPFLDHRESVMSEYANFGGPKPNRLASYYKTVFLPRPHDFLDIQDLWR